MGKSTISMVIFNSYVKLPEGKTTMKHHLFSLWIWQFWSVHFIPMVGGAMCPSWKMMEWKSMGFGWHHIYEMENKNHVPNHQPDIIRYYNPLFRHYIAIILPLYCHYIAIRLLFCPKTPLFSPHGLRRPPPAAFRPGWWPPSRPRLRDASRAKARRVLAKRRWPWQGKPRQRKWRKMVDLTIKHGEFTQNDE